MLHVGLQAQHCLNTLETEICLHFCGIAKRGRERDCVCNQTLVEGVLFRIRVNSSSLSQISFRRQTPIEVPLTNHHLLLLFLLLLPLYHKQVKKTEQIHKASRVCHCMSEYIQRLPIPCVKKSNLS